MFFAYLTWGLWGLINVYKVLWTTWMKGLLEVQSVYYYNLERKITFTVLEFDKHASIKPLQYIPADKMFLSNLIIFSTVVGILY